MEDINNSLVGDYVVVKAEDNNVQVIGLTRGNMTKPHHTEILQNGELLIMQFTENTSAVKIRGNCTVYSKHGQVIGGKN